MNVRDTQSVIDSENKESNVRDDISQSQSQNLSIYGSMQTKTETQHPQQLMTLNEMDKDGMNTQNRSDLDIQTQTQQYTQNNINSDNDNITAQQKIQQMSINVNQQILNTMQQTQLHPDQTSATHTQPKQLFKSKPLQSPTYNPVIGDFSPPPQNPNHPYNFVVGNHSPPHISPNYPYMSDNETSESDNEKSDNEENDDEFNYKKNLKGPTFVRLHRPLSSTAQKPEREQDVDFKVFFFKFFCVTFAVVI